MQLTVSGVAGSRSPEFELMHIFQNIFYELLLLLLHCITISLPFADMNAPIHILYISKHAHSSRVHYGFLLWSGVDLKGLVAAGRSQDQLRKHDLTQLVKEEKRQAGRKTEVHRKKGWIFSKPVFSKIVNANPSRGACSTFLCLCRRGIDFINVRSLTWMNLRFFHISRVTESFPLLSKCLTTLSA